VLFRSDLAERLGTPASLRDLSMSLARVGDLSISEGDRAGARLAFEQSLGIARDLAKRLGTPASLRDLSVSLERVGDLSLSEGDREGARVAYSEAIGHAREARQLSNTFDVRMCLSGLLLRVSGLQLARGHVRDAGRLGVEAYRLTVSSIWEFGNQRGIPRLALAPLMPVGIVVVLWKFQRAAFWAVAVASLCATTALIWWFFAQ
jgi:hypothetical protein